MTTPELDTPLTRRERARELVDGVPEHWRAEARDLPPVTGDIPLREFLGRFAVSTDDLLADLDRADLLIAFLVDYLLIGIDGDPHEAADLLNACPSDQLGDLVVAVGRAARIALEREAEAAAV